MTAHVPTYIRLIFTPWFKFGIQLNIIPHVVIYYVINNIYSHSPYSLNLVTIVFFLFSNLKNILSDIIFTCVFPFQEDNYPKHTAKLHTSRFFRRKKSGRISVVNEMEF